MSLRCYSLRKAMYRPVESVDWCQCCQRGVAFSNLEGSSDFFGNHDSSQIVYATNNSCCGARHIRRLSKAFLICRPRPLAHLASSATGGARFTPQFHHTRVRGYFIMDKWPCQRKRRPGDGAYMVVFCKMHKFSAN